MTACGRCGTVLPGDAAFCYRCGSTVSRGTASAPAASAKGTAVPFAALKCPSCGAPITPRFGEMIITCGYCGNGVTLGSEGWKNVQKHTMLPLKVSDRDVVVSTVHSLLNKGILRWHVWERSTLEEMTLRYVPYWIVSVSARTSIVAVDTAAQMANVATTAAILGTAAAAAGGRGVHRHGGALDAAVLGGVVAGGRGLGGGGPMLKAYQMSENHNYPVVALKALTEYQPHDFEFALIDRQLFDASKAPKGVRILNGDVGEDDAKHQARVLVDQLQSRKAHKKYSMIQRLETEIGVGDAELLHVPAWLARYDFKGRKITVVVDGNSGTPIHAVGLEG